MHMADALIVPGTAGVMFAASGAAAAYSIYKVRQENAPEKVPVMGVMGAFVFAAQMINFTIPGTGSSGHLCGGLLLSAILGPYAAFLTMIGVLLVQCLFFADGGLLALGCNIWNMAFYGCFVGALLIWKNLMKNGASKGKITLSSILGCVITLQMGAFSVCVETYVSGISSLPFGAFLTAMLSPRVASARSFKRDTPREAPMPVPLPATAPSVRIVCFAALSASITAPFSPRTVSAPPAMFPSFAMAEVET